MGGIRSIREEQENVYTNYIAKFEETVQLRRTYVHGSKYSARVQYVFK